MPNYNHGFWNCLEICLYEILHNELYINNSFLFQHSSSFKHEEILISVALGTPVNITAKTFKSYKGVSTMHLTLNYITDLSFSQWAPWTFFLFPFDPRVLISEDITAVVLVKLFLIEQSPSNAKYHRNMNFQIIKLLMIIWSEVLPQLNKPLQLLFDECGWSWFFL